MPDSTRRVAGLRGIFGYFTQRVFCMAKKMFDVKTAILFNGGTWKEFHLEALGLKAKAFLLLNPFDEGFSREFYAYGFREPLNTLAIFRTVEKTKPVVLDIGSNLGYFPIVELKAGAKYVIGVEPVPSSFALLSRTLRDYRNVTVSNIAISDKHENLTLYVSNKRNVTSSSMSLLAHTGHRIVDEISVRAAPLLAFARQHPINMVRMDVEGHEYTILKGKIPDQIVTICIELHILHPYSKINAVRLLQHLNRQGFQASIAINEIKLDHYPVVKYLGLKRAYKLVTALEENGPSIQQNVSLAELLKEIPEIGQMHLILQR